MNNRQSLLKRILAICYNSGDIFTLDEWSALTIEQLRTVVALLDDGGADEIIKKRHRSQTRGHCYLLEELVRYLREHPHATNPHTRRPITARQREIIQHAYQRATGRMLRIPVDPTSLKVFDFTDSPPPPRRRVGSSRQTR